MVRSSSFKLFFSILSLILAILLVFNIFKFSFSNSDLSFSSFLNWLGTVNNIRINFSISDFFIQGNWGVIDGLRQYFNVFAQIFGVIVYLGAQLINLIIFIGQFIGFLFA